MNNSAISALLAGPLAPWTLTVRSGLTGEVTLTGTEVRDLCAAIELDRVQRGDAVALLTQRRISRRPLEWRALMDGAHGLQRTDAPGEITVAEALTRVGVEVLSWTLVEKPDAALKRMKAASR